MKNILWNNYKLYIIGKSIEPSENIRVKFYRAINIYKKMKSYSPDYLQGFFDGARLDEQTKEFIRFIIRILSEE